TVDPAISIIQDGIVLTFPAGVSVNMFDLESVEILRGPQGTLFGRNSTGGAILLRTRLPEPRLRVIGEITEQSFGTTIAILSAEGPIAGRTLLGKLALTFNSSDGAILNATKGVFTPAPMNPDGEPVR